MVQLPSSHLGIARKVLETVRKEDRNCLPAISLDAGAGASSLVGDASGRAAVRISSAEMKPDVATKVAKIAKGAGVNVSQSHLIIDLGFLDRGVVGTLEATLPVLLPMLSPENWARVTIAGTAMPKTIAAPPSSITKLPRLELSVWKSLISQTGSGGTRYHFGDYAVTNPELVEYKPKFMDMSPRIVYTAESYWVILKGKGVKATGWEQTRGMCKKLRALEEFQGQDFSVAGDYIVRCSNGSASTGSPGTWKRISTNHHLTFVARQIASLA